MGEVPTSNVKNGWNGESLPVQVRAILVARTPLGFDRRASGRRPEMARTLSRILGRTEGGLLPSAVIQIPKAKASIATPASISIATIAKPALALMYVILLDLHIDTTPNK